MNTPRCPHCGSPLCWFEDEQYCPNCLTFSPCETEHRSPGQQARNDPDGYRRQQEATNGDQQ
jgi:uncharacterized Zn finger protein (UPF0148 family)